MMKVERLPIDATILGEGPHWDVETQTLYYVDTLSSMFIKYTPKTQKIVKASVAPKRPSLIVPVAGRKDEFIVTLSNEVAIIRWEGDSEEVTVKEILYTANETSKITFNDGKVDPNGRLWTGTLQLDLENLYGMPPVGNLYSIDSKRQVKKHLDKIRIANGLAFNEKTKKFYYIDSLSGSVDQFDFDENTGEIANRKVHFTLKKANIPGIPDGMTIDTDGNLWVAIFNGSRVIKIDGTKPECLLETVEMPVKQVTSVIWGGSNLDELFVTTASIEEEGVKPPAPMNGTVYRVTGTGAKGLPGFNYKLA